MPEQQPHSHHRWQHRLFAGLLLWVVAGLAQAQDADRASGGQGLRISGFGTLGVSHVDAPEGWGFRRERTQGSGDASVRADVDTRLGVQLNYSLSSQLEFVAQAIAKKRGTYAQNSDALEWAYASYRPNAHWTLRAGRVNLDAFLMADYRNVGYGFTAARPPVELYGMLPTALDGVDVARSWFQGDAQWRAKLMVGTVSIGDYDVSRTSRTRDGIVGFMVSREEGGLLVRASVSRAEVKLNLTEQRAVLDALGQLTRLPLPTVASQAGALIKRLGAEPLKALFTEVGLRHELADWQWSAEYVHIEGDPLIKQRSAYVTVGRRLGDWTPYVGFGTTRDAMQVAPMPAWQAPLTPVLGPALAAQLQGLGSAVTAAVNGTRVHQSTWSVGARWDFHPQSALKLQLDSSHVRTAGSGLWTRAEASGGRARVATVMVDFIF